MKVSRMTGKLIGQAAVGLGIGLATGLMQGTATLARKMSKDGDNTNNKTKHCKHCSCHHQSELPNGKRQ
jgi:hypothetical protein